MITDAWSADLEERIAAVEPYFSAVTLVLVGEDRADTGLLPTLRLPVGCDVAAELIAQD